jgi:Carboxypeptidase regulatory-like domain
MNTRKNLLDRVEINSPCAANWDEMKGTDQVRYCSECQKYVYNLSEMTQREAESLLASRGNQMCARLIRDLEGQTLTVESLPPVRLLGWKPGPLATAVVSALISITPMTVPLANAQAASHASQSEDGPGTDSRRPAPGSLTSAITGIVSNESGAPLSGAIVVLTSEATGDVLSQMTSDEGEFRFEGLPARTYIVEVRYNGYRAAAHHDLELQQGETRRLDFPMEKLVIVSGIVSIPPQPLRTLYLNSDRVVVAQVGKSTAEAKDGSSRLVRTSLVVSRTLKGDGHKPALTVSEMVYGKRGQFTEGETVLAFLRRGSDANSYSSSEEFGQSVKHLSESDLELYIQRLAELKAITSNSESDSADVVDWLVRCAEDPGTRHEGAFELNASAWREHWVKEEMERSATAGEPASGTRKSPRDEEPFFAALLTSDQKQRLMNALLKSEELGSGDFELIELAMGWNDPRLLPSLISYLHRVEETVPAAAERVMQSVADILDDEKVSGLLSQYRDDASYEDTELERGNDVEDAEDEDEDAIETESTNASDDADTTPKLTPEAARQARVDMLKKFIEAAEARIKLAPAK